MHRRRRERVCRTWKTVIFDKSTREKHHFAHVTDVELHSLETTTQYSVMSSESDPPTYSIPSTGFPQGYFLIRNLGTGKLLDVEQEGRNDGKLSGNSHVDLHQRVSGAEVILFPLKESSHVIGKYHILMPSTIYIRKNIALRDVGADNQASTCLIHYHLAMNTSILFSFAGVFC